MSYQQKYLKYKSKYLDLKKQAESLKSQNGGKLTSIYGVNDINLNNLLNLS